ncbi:uncharacterized protein LOC101849977 isoform X2 [Aplysia californica]|nr:uncharacterized protein LOC101849977 isoform X2 [Aplysia californica]
MGYTSFCLFVLISITAHSSAQDASTTVTAATATTAAAAATVSTASRRGASTHATAPVSVTPTYPLPTVSGGSQGPETSTTTTTRPRVTQSPWFPTAPMGSPVRNPWLYYQPFFPPYDATSSVYNMYGLQGSLPFATPYSNDLSRSYAIQLLPGSGGMWQSPGTGAKKTPALLMPTQKPSLWF